MNAILKAVNVSNESWISKDALLYKDIINDFKHLSKEENCYNNIETKDNINLDKVSEKNKNYTYYNIILRRTYCTSLFGGI